jgi:hypothetical protein
LDHSSIHAAGLKSEKSPGPKFESDRFGLAGRWRRNNFQASPWRREYRKEVVALNLPELEEAPSNFCWSSSRDNFDFTDVDKTREQ